MSSIFRAIRNRLGTIGYRTKLVLFILLFALALSSTFLQLSYGYMWVRSILSGAPDCEDYDILDLGFHSAQPMYYFGDETFELIGEFKTRGYVYWSERDMQKNVGVFLKSFAFSKGMSFSIFPAENMRYLPTNGSFVEVRGELYQVTTAYGRSAVYGRIQSWRHCSIAYEVLVDLLTFGEMSGTFVLLVWSGRVIGSSIASRAYLKRRHMLEAI